MKLTLVLIIISVQVFTLATCVYLNYNDSCEVYSRPTFEERLYQDLHVETEVFIQDWNTTLDYKFMYELMNSTRPPGACDYDQLLKCVPREVDSTCNKSYPMCNTGGCVCSFHFSQPETNNTRSCKGLVGYPCGYQKIDPENRSVLLIGNMTCTDHAECTNIFNGKDSEKNNGNSNDTVEKILDKSGVLFKHGGGEIILPIYRYIIRNVISVCTCKIGFYRTGFGLCEKTNSTNKSNSRIVGPFSMIMNPLFSTIAIYIVFLWICHHI